MVFFAALSTAERVVVGVLSRADQARLDLLRTLFTRWFECVLLARTGQ